MAVNIGPRIGIDGEKQYRAQLQNIIQQTKTLKSQMAAVGAAFDRDGKKLQANREKRKLLTQAIETQKKKLVELKAAAKASADRLGEDSTNALKWKQAVADAETELAKMEGELKNIPSAAEEIGNKFQAAGEKVKNIGEKVKKVGDAMSDVGTKMTMGITLPVAALGAGAVKAFSDYESAFTGVTKTVDATSEEYEELSNWIKEASTKMASSKEDIAGTMEVAGQLGVEGVGNLETFTETMIKLGDTTNLSAEDAATALAKFNNITGDSNGNVDKLGAAIVDLGNNFATDEAAIVEMSSRLASAATVAGFSSTDILALSTAMSSVGINAEAGGSAMSQSMTKISNAVAKGADESNESLQLIADTAGMTQEEFVAAWQDKPIEALQAFIGGLNNVNESGGNVNDILKDLGMTGIRESNMLKALALSSENMGAALDTANSAYEENIALNNEANKRYETTASKLSQAKEAISNTAISIGEKLAPVIIDAADRFAGMSDTIGDVGGKLAEAFIPIVEKGVDIIGKVIEKYNELSPQQQELITKVAALATVLGPVLLVGGKIVSAVGSIISVGGSLISGIGMIIPVIGTVVGAIGGLAASAIAAIPAIVAFMAPFLPFIAIGAAVVAAGVLIYKNWDKIKAAAKKLGETIKKVFGKIGEVTSKIFGAIKDTVTKAMDKVKEHTKKRLDNMKQAFDDAGGGIKGVAAAMAQGIKDNFKDGFDALNKLTGGKLGELKDKFVEKFEGIKDKLKNVQTVMRKDQSETLAKMKKAYSDAGGGFKGVVAAAMEKVKGKFKTAYDAINTLTNGKLGNVVSKVKSKSAAMLSAFKSKLSSMVSNAKSKMTAVKDNIVNGLKGAVDKVKSIGENIVKGLWNGISNMVGWIKSKIQGFGESVLSALKSFFGIHSPSVLMEKVIGKNIALGVAAGITKNKTQAALAAKGLADDTKKKLEKELKKSEQTISSAAEKVVKAMLGTYQKAKKYSVKDPFGQALVKSAKAELKELKKNNDITIQEEINFWKKLVKETKKGSKARAQAQKAQAKAEKSLQKSITKLTKQYVKDVAAVQSELAEKINEIDTQLAENISNVNAQLASDIASQIESAESSIASAWDSLASSIQSRADSIKFNLFDEVEVDEALGGQELISRLKEQVKTLADYETSMAQLKERIGDTDLYREIAEQGPKALKQVQSLNTLTDEELKEYQSYYDEREAISQREAAEELSREAAQTAAEVAAIQAESDAKIAALNAAAADELKALQDAAEAERQAAITEAKKQIEDLNSQYTSDLKALGVSLKNSGKSVGKNIIKGIKAGLKSENLSSTISSVANDLIKQLKKSFKIKSPSRVMRDEIGKYLILGVADGIERNEGAVTKAMRAVDYSMAPLGYSGMTSGGVVNQSSVTTGDNIVHIYTQPGQDADAIADAVMDKIQSGYTRQLRGAM